MEPLRIPRNPYGFHGILKDSMESFKILWNPEGFNGILQDFMESTPAPIKNKKNTKKRRNQAKEGGSLAMH